MPSTQATSWVSAPVHNRRRPVTHPPSPQVSICRGRATPRTINSHVDRSSPPSPMPHMFLPGGAIWRRCELWRIWRRLNLLAMEDWYYVLVRNETDAAKLSPTWFLFTYHSLFFAFIVENTKHQLLVFFSFQKDLRLYIKVLHVLTNTLLQKKSTPKSLGGEVFFLLHPLTMRRE